MLIVRAHERNAALDARLLIERAATSMPTRSGPSWQKTCAGRPANKPSRTRDKASSAQAEGARDGPQGLPYALVNLPVSYAIGRQRQPS